MNQPLRQFVIVHDNPWWKKKGMLPQEFKEASRLAREATTRRQAELAKVLRGIFEQQKWVEVTSPQGNRSWIMSRMPTRPGQKPTLRLGAVDASGPSGHQEFEWPTPPATAEQLDVFWGKVAQDLIREIPREDDELTQILIFLDKERSLLDYWSKYPAWEYGFELLGIVSRGNSLRIQGKYEAASADEQVEMAKLRERFPTRPAAPPTPAFLVGLATTGNPSYEEIRAHFETPQQTTVDPTAPSRVARYAAPLPDLFDQNGGLKQGSVQNLVTSLQPLGWPMALEVLVMAWLGVNEVETSPEAIKWRIDHATTWHKAIRSGAATHTATDDFKWEQLARAILWVFRERAIIAGASTLTWESDLYTDVLAESNFEDIYTLVQRPWRSWEPDSDDYEAYHRGLVMEQHENQVRAWQQTPRFHQEMATALRSWWDELHRHFAFQQGEHTQLEVGNWFNSSPQTVSGPKAPQHRMVLFQTCPNVARCDVDTLIATEDDGVEISLDTFRKWLAPGELEDFENAHGYTKGRKSGLKLADDYAVEYYKSHWGPYPCVFIDWSAITHIYMNPEDIQQISTGVAGTKAIPFGEPEGGFPTPPPKQPQAQHTPPLVKKQTQPKPPKPTPKFTEHFDPNDTLASRLGDGATAQIGILRDPVTPERQVVIKIKREGTELRPLFIEKTKDAKGKTKWKSESLYFGGVHLGEPVVELLRSLQDYFDAGRGEAHEKFQVEWVAPPVPPKPKVAKAPLTLLEEAKVRLKDLKQRKYKTAGEEKVIEGLEAWLAADPAKWKPGMGVAWHVTWDQWNHGFRVVEVLPDSHEAEIVQVADTGLTRSGGNDPLSGETTLVRLSELRRERKYDAPEWAGT